MNLEELLKVQDPDILKNIILTLRNEIIKLHKEKVADDHIIQTFEDALLEAYEELKKLKAQKTTSVLLGI